MPSIRGKVNAIKSDGTYHHVEVEDGSGNKETLKTDDLSDQVILPTMRVNTREEATFTYVGSDKRITEIDW